MKSEKLSEKFNFNSFQSKVDANLRAYKQLKIDASEYDEWEMEDRFGRMQEILEELTDLCTDAVRESGSDIAVFNVIVGLMHEEYEKEDGKYELVFSKTLQIRFLRDIYKADENVVDITRRATRETIEEEAEKAVNA